jgi:hypothetical protein
MARLMLTWLLAGAVAPVGAQDPFRLVSAQVVTAGDRPPTLKLSANGPIAYRVFRDEDAGDAVPGRIRARLYGVHPGEIGALGPLAPFSLSAVREGHDTILTVSAAGSLRGAELVIRSGGRSNEIEVTAQY